MDNLQEQIDIGETNRKIKEYDRHMATCAAELAMCDRLLDLAIAHLKKSHEQYKLALRSCKGIAVPHGSVIEVKLNRLLIEIHQSDNLMNEQPIRGLVENGQKYIGEFT